MSVPFVEKFSEIIVKIHQDDSIFILIAIIMYVAVILRLWRSKLIRLEWTATTSETEKISVHVENINSIKSTYNFWLFVNIISFAVAVIWAWSDYALPVDKDDLIRHIPRYLVMAGYFSFITVQLGRYYKFFVDNVKIE